METRTALDSIDKMTRGYLECALWASSDGDGNPLDDEYSADGFAPLEIAEASKLCARFAEENAADLEGIEPSQAGHDLWLTRNHHGAGFWDRGLGEVGERLSKAAQALGECYAYVGDDGMVWID
jgi:hypothetical protein